MQWQVEPPSQPLRLTALQEGPPPQLAAIAEAWLAAGAATFALWAGAELVARWPVERAPTERGLRAPIELGGLRVAELEVSGIDDERARQRLVADAALVARLVELEGDLEGMTSELIDVQDQLLALYDLTQSTRSHLDLHTLLHIVVREATRLLRTAGAFAVVRQGDGPPLVVQSGLEPLGHALAAELFGRLQARGDELLIGAEESAALPGGQIRNLYLGPIWLTDRSRSVQGALGLWNKPDGFNSPDLKLIRAIAEQAGAQIENVLLHQATVARAKWQTEMELARTVQLRLLPPRPPQTSGVDVWATSRPALEVGGDFYDLLCEPRRPLVFSVGDVSGKGMSAALLMAMTRTVLHSAARFLPQPTPTRLMDRLNADLYDDFTEVSMFATVFVGTFDHSQRRLHYANAGHAPALYRPADGAARMLEADGPPIGVMPINEWQPQQLALGPGDLLVVATDGLNEAANEQGELFGYERLLHLIDALAASTAHEIGQALLEAVRQFSGAQAQSDDQTLLVVKGV